MNLMAIKEAIRVAVANCTEIPLVNIQWVNTPQSGMWRNWPTVDLVFRNPRAIGQDCQLVGYDTPNDRLTRTISGPRQFRVEIRIEVDNQTPGECADLYIMRFKARRHRPAVAGALALATVNVATMSEGINADFAVDGRMVSLSTLDVVFNTVENDVDTTEVGDYATTLIFESTPEGLKSPDGTPAQNQVVVTVPEE